MTSRVQITHAVQENNANRRNNQVVKNLLKSENLQVREQLVRARSRLIKITADRMCPVCNRCVRVVCVCVLCVCVCVCVCVCMCASSLGLILCLFFRRLGLSGF